MIIEAEREARYVRRVQEGTRRFVERLLNENETLRSVLVQCEREKLALEGRLLALEAQPGRVSEAGGLRRKIEPIHRSGDHSTAEYLRLEHQNDNLANLYVASYRLHTTLDRREILSVIREILVELDSTHRRFTRGYALSMGATGKVRAHGVVLLRRLGHDSSSPE